MSSFKIATISAISISASIAASATSANAFTIGGNITYSSSFNPPPPVITAGFSNETVIGIDADFSPAGTSVAVADLPLTITNLFVATSPSIPNFITGFQYQNQPAVFDLAAGADTAILATANGLGALDFTFGGLIKSTGGDTLATVTGTFSGAETSTNNDFSIDLAATPVPTPALLPGLLGMGMGIVRKRKQQSVAA